MASSSSFSSVIRILGLLGRTEHSERGGIRPEALTPTPIKKFLESVAIKQGLDAGTLELQLEGIASDQAVSRAIAGWLLKTGSADSSLVFQPAGKKAWRCSRCNFVHLHPSLGVCANRQCFSRDLVEVDMGEPEDQDYYAWLAHQLP